MYIIETLQRQPTIALMEFRVQNEFLNAPRTCHSKLPSLPGFGKGVVFGWLQLGGAVGS